MLTLWRRHRSECRHKADRYFRKCKCAMWCEGTVEGAYRRESLKTRSWERAEELKREIEDGKKPAAPAITLRYATDTFIADLTAQNRTGDTIRKYKLLFKQLAEFGERNGPSDIAQFTFDVLVKFRGEWAEAGPATRNKKLDRLKAFFGFCHDAGWVPTNPTKAIKPGSALKARVQPFSADEQRRILAKPQTARIRAFVHTLYHSGLRISDCCFLRPEDFDGNCIRRTNRKNQVEIYVPMPPDLKAELDRVSLSGGYYFLIGESVNLHTQTDAWRSVLNDLYPKSEFPGFHPHRLRHTRVVEWLAAGLTMEEISGMLGTSVKILEKHYASFAPARQQVVAEKLSRTWHAAPKLVRVK